MGLSRRGFLGAVGIAGTVGTSGVWAREVRQMATVQGVGVPAGVVRILYNENPLGPSLLAVKAASAVLPGSNRYPMADLFGLIAKLHSLHGLPFSVPADTANLGALFAALDESRVLLGTGSTEILRGIALAYSLEGGEIVEAKLGYPEIGADAQQMLGNRIRRVQIPLTDDYRHDVDGMLRAVNQKTRIVVVTNPNNPTGTAISLAEITRLADGLGPKSLLVVDEAYIDFARGPGVASAIGLATTRPNVIVTRTFSKIHGLAGLRLGYGVASKPVMRKIRPYLMNLLGINAPASAAAAASLEDVAYLTRSRQVVLEARRRLAQSLPALGLTPIASEANFVWVKVGKDCTPLVDRLAARGVLIAGGQRWDQPNYVRISAGLPAEMDTLLDVLA